MLGGEYARALELLLSLLLLLLGGPPSGELSLRSLLLFESPDLAFEPGTEASSWAAHAGRDPWASLTPVMASVAWRMWSALVAVSTNSQEARQKLALSATASSADITRGEHASWCCTATFAASCRQFQDLLGSSMADATSFRAFSLRARVAISRPLSSS